MLFFVFLVLYFFLFLKHAFLCCGSLSITSPSPLHHLSITSSSPLRHLSITSPSPLHHLHHLSITSSSPLHHLFITSSSPLNHLLITSPSPLHHLSPFLFVRRTRLLNNAFVSRGILIFLALVSA